MGKPTSPLIDHGLGFVILELFAKTTYVSYSASELPLLLQCLLVTVVGILASKRLFGTIGKKLSSFRTKRSIPKKDRDPLSSDVVLKKVSYK